MKYQSKKDPTVVAEVKSYDEKCKTVILEYTDGPDKGKSLSITTSTLKRWWKKLSDDEDSAVEDPVDEREEKGALAVDSEKVNETYAPDVTPHYIPKPESVVNYENKKRKRYNQDLPDFEDVVSRLESKAVKINENSHYLKFEDKTTLWRKPTAIFVYAAEKTWEALTNKGLQSSNNNDKDRPFAFKIESAEDFEKVVEAIVNG